MSRNADGQTQSLKGRTVLVVGAHGGLGQALALALARDGVHTVLLGRKAVKLNRLHDTIVSTDGVAPLLYPLDLEGATPEDFVELAGRVDGALGRLDGIVHCAAHFPGLTPLELTQADEFARALHVNLTARWWLTQACVPLLRQATDAAVVFALDTTAINAAYWGGYGLAQAALAALVPMLQAELDASTIRISGFMPGPLRTSLRARAFVEGTHPAHDPASLTQACLSLLSPAGHPWRGKVWTADTIPTPAT